MSTRGRILPRFSLSFAPVGLAVLVAALGYFVDLYDIVLFSILRVPSLRALGVAGADLTNVGGMLLDAQLAGMLLGGITLGILADKRGRLSVVFASIVLYSLANLGNAFVTSVGAYGALRFVAGFGLSGELGAGITLVAELLPKEKRGFGTTLVASVGVSGALSAAATADVLLRRFGDGGFRYAYALGGVAGLALLVLRLGVLESGLFESARTAAVRRGDVRMLVRPAARGFRFLRVVLVGVPIWYAAGVLFVFAPEIGGALGLTHRPSGTGSIFWSYVGVVFGDVTSGLLSQRLARRKVVLAAFLVLLGITVALLFAFGGTSLNAFYGLLAFVGFGTGYWVVFLTTAAEQFGTNLRGTVTTSAPNFVRGAAIPITSTWLALKPRLGPVGAASVLGVTCIALALWALSGLRETFHADLDVLET